MYLSKTESTTGLERFIWNVVVDLSSVNIKEMTMLSPVP